ncbi:MAG: CPBP family glutamic-type intramembrane protease [Candidatus Hermodarchaeia archaeon]|jgi:membrane protease YdiL (CAAX protease family)
MARYYTEDVVANVAWWFAILAGVLVLVWSQAHPDYLYIGIIQIVMLLAGKWMYPEQRLGRVQDNPLQRKSRREQRYTSGRFKTILAITVGLLAIMLIQILLLSSFMFSLDIHLDLFRLYTGVSAGISESYFFHWGIQTNLTTFINKWAGIIMVPVLAVILHSAVYGTSGTLLLMVGLGFLVFAYIFEYTRRLSVPLIVHLVVNVLGG